MVHTDYRKEGNLNKRDLAKESSSRAGPPLFDIQDEPTKKKKRHKRQRGTVDRDRDGEETGPERR